MAPHVYTCLESGVAVLPEPQPLEIGTAPTGSSTLGASFKSELAQYAGKIQQVAATGCGPRIKDRDGALDPSYHQMTL